MHGTLYCKRTAHRPHRYLDIFKGVWNKYYSKANMTELTLLDTLTLEVELMVNSGEHNLTKLHQDSQDLLDKLKDIEASLITQVQLEETVNQQPDDQIIPILLKQVPLNFKSLDLLSKFWYKSSIDNLKSYNSSINRFHKRILTNSKYHIELDDAYFYPLVLNNFPVSLEQIEPPKINGSTNHTAKSKLLATKVENREVLLKAIILHLLKMGQCDIVSEFVHEFSADSDIVIDKALLEKFERLKKIVDDIMINHDIRQALTWFNNKHDDEVALKSAAAVGSNTHTRQYSYNNEAIEFKFHMLQFILLLNGSSRENDGSFSLDNAFHAYTYSKTHFARFFKDYLNEISPLMMLLLFESDKTQNNADIYSRTSFKKIVREFMEKLKFRYNVEKGTSDGNQGESKFVSELLNSFDHIHDSQVLFVNLANEFISEYCKDLKLSNDSSLFQGVLAGLIYLPSFYKYKKIQMKIGKASDSNNDKLESGERLSVAPYTFDLPFQLPDSCRFLFNHHPIFICPVSKDQLIPGIEYHDEPSSLKRRNSSLDPSIPPLGSPVVVLNFCKHVALRESIWQLSKKGTEMFDCHYCYKVHNYNNISDAYFIDL